MKLNIKSKFNIGDEVECIENLILNDEPGYGWKCGLKFRIRSITVSDNMFIYWKGNNEYGVYEPFLKKVNINCSKIVLKKVENV